MHEFEEEVVVTVATLVVQRLLDLGKYLSSFGYKDEIAMEDISLVEGKATVPW